MARFPSTQQKIVEAVKIFDPRNLPEGVKLSSYGEDELDKLAIHYSSFVDHNECQLGGTS